ncbi:MAG: (d)CMP kinase [Ktedonobacterales bacterium]|nr:(d)CMP kinase [Ktedonobacterales bacterium]
MREHHLREHHLREHHLREHPRIAIDGPAGVGKSTIGERVARRLACLYVDTGAFYRALTGLALRQGINVDDAAALATLAEHADIRIIPPTVSDGRQYTVLVDGADITADLRTPAVEAAVSRVSAAPAVRVALIAQMRRMADDHTVVMVGRDIGTVVLPDADLKIYLMTSIEERARRRHGDLVAQLGAASPPFEAVHDDIARRDATDQAQMRPAPDAIMLHNDHLEPEQTVEHILRYLRERLERSGKVLASEDQREVPR